MPVFQPVPPVSYIEQLVQPSRLAWVDANASDWEVVTNLSRRWKAPNAASAISVSAKRHQGWIKQSRRLIDMSTYRSYLLKKQKLREEEIEEHKASTIDK